MTGDDLEAAIRAVYRGPLEEFIGRRDALARQLRAEKRREGADRVKALRKPSRMAWALDQVVFADPALVERLERAIEAARGERTRAAQDDVRAAVRGIAEAGARESIRGGNAIESGALVTALRAVIGDGAALAELRAGRLVEVPEGGGLDLLLASVPSEPPAAVVAPAEKPARPAAHAEALRAEHQRAEAFLAQAQERARAAERTALRAQADLKAAENRLQHAKREAEERRSELERARRNASTAASEVAGAEGALAALRDDPRSNPSGVGKVRKRTP